ncbi:T-cell receptor gamma alternate reading frame protein [Carettochelys insculpta]|uniref:T-cell receptor gamma alternate reading frame protein n=1 Tax=Carettochelys insculpta TaxID=44489 RepID=UPI003EC05D67
MNPATEAQLNPEKIQILSSSIQNKVTHICLIEDFYPDVIKMSWKGNNAEKNGVQGEIWSLKGNQESYSVSSWLTVDEVDTKYECTYQHESKSDSVFTGSPDTSAVPRTPGDCIKMLPPDMKANLLHRTAYLIYIILLLKSTMYYAIVLFFMYKKKGPNKQQGKKP